MEAWLVTHARPSSDEQQSAHPLSHKNAAQERRIVNLRNREEIIALTVDSRNVFSMEWIQA